MQSALTLDEPVENAASFVVAAQDADGAWRDFQLKPGRSEAWVTAYVGASLLRVAGALRCVDAAPALAGARSFINAARDPRGGWGYNTRCAPDADSTARAILFLRAIGDEVPLRDYAALAKFQLDSGDFATYRASEGRPGWCAGHPDVTVVALRALSGVLPAGHVILRKGRARLAAYVRETSSTAAYWWPSPLYLANELLRLQREDGGAPRFALSRCDLSSGVSCFHEALALEIAVLLEMGAARRGAISRRLAARQNADGSWPSAPILRITDPLSSALGDRRFRQSEIASDDRRIFTTATVMAALHAAEQGSP